MLEKRTYKKPESLAKGLLSTCAKERLSKRRTRAAVPTLHGKSPSLWSLRHPDSPLSTPRKLNPSSSVGAMHGNFVKIPDVSSVPESLGTILLLSFSLTEKTITFLLGIKIFTARKAENGGWPCWKGCCRAEDLTKMADPCLCIHRRKGAALPPNAPVTPA